MVAETLCPWSFGASDTKFDIQNPTVAGLLAQFKTEDDIAMIAQCILDSYFGDQTCNLFAEPLDDNEGNSDGLPCKLAVAMLTKYESVDETLLETLPNLVVEAMDEVFLAARAIIAISLPVPGIHDSTYADAKSVFARDASQLAGKHLQDFRTAVYLNPAWKARAESYWTCGMADQAVAPKYKQLIEGMAPEISLDESAAVVKEAIEELPKWCAKLRSGACDPLRASIESWVCRVKVDEHLDKDMLDLLLKAVSIVDPRSAKRALQEVMETAKKYLSVALSKSSVNKVAAFLSDGHALSNLTAFAESLEQAAGLTIVADVAGKLEKTRLELLGIVQDKCKDNSIQQAHIFVAHLRANHCNANAKESFPRHPSDRDLLCLAPGVLVFSAALCRRRKNHSVRLFQDFPPNMAFWGEHPHAC
jgi:hypothetical protein